MKVGKAAGVVGSCEVWAAILADGLVQPYFDASGNSLLLTCVMTQWQPEPIMHGMADLALAGAMPDSSSGAIRLLFPSDDATVCASRAAMPAVTPGVHMEACR